MGAWLRAAMLVLWTHGAAWGDVWSYEDKDGVLHLTNIRPGAGPQRWKQISRSGPGKAQTLSGAIAAPETKQGAAKTSDTAESSEVALVGCADSRVDAVPARDRSPERFHRYDAIINEAAGRYALPTALIRAIIKAESDYDPRVVSCAGARGLMQLMPEVEREQRVRDVFDPRDNIQGGSRLLRTLANRFRGDMVLTIAGYHAGAGAVQRYGGVPPYETTQAYVRAVLRNFRQYQKGIGRHAEVGGGAPRRSGLK